jgi:hypothetical protein
MKNPTPTSTDTSTDIIDHHIEFVQRYILHQLDNMVGVHVRLTKSAYTLKLLPSTPATDSTIASIVAEREAIMERIREIRQLLDKPCGDVWCPGVE